MTHIAAPAAPRFEHRSGATVLGLQLGRPRLSWRTPSAPEAYAQDAYELEIARDSRAAERFVVESREQVLVDWPTAPLRSREHVSVRVRVRGGDAWSAWSEPSTAEAGLLDPAEWTARFVTPVGIGGMHQAAPQLRGSIDIPGRVVRARLYATAHGVLAPAINGRPADDAVLAPGWTAYEQRLRYRVYDVTSLVRSGRNDLDVVLGNGWWRGRLGFLGERARYGRDLALLAQLEVETEDGATHVLATDDTWRARATGILEDDLYDGQTTDLRVDGGAFDAPVRTIDADLSILVGEDGPPVRVTETLPAQTFTVTARGTTVVDFGQNLVGWVRIRVAGGTPGQEVVVRHAEVLQDGELATVPLRTARATDRYYLREGAQELVPSLTFHGFRYAEISGLGDLALEDVEAEVLGTDLVRTGWFDSSSELLDRFHDNVVWGMRGNFLDVPTDCPQRDERLGWTGDIQIFAPTASYLFDTAGFLTSWLADLALEQHDDGRVPHVIPDIVRTTLTSEPAAAWGDAAVVVPWVLWERTGDRAVLAAQYDSMTAWVRALTAIAGESLLWRGGFQYGDWLDPTAPPQDPAAAKADPDVVATACFARCADLLAHAAAVLGHDADAREFADLARGIRAAFRAAYVSADGRIISDAQTVYAAAIVWDLLEDDALRAAAGERLADLVRASDFRIATGFVGTPVICDALTDTGHADLAVRLLLQTAGPSWLYAVTMGATTVWERWDSLLPDGSINPGEMTSFNHYALGSVVDWMHRRIAGLAPVEPGYRRIAVRPLPTRALDRASARHDTPYGEAAVAWSRQGGSWHIEVRVPVGTTADVELPFDGGRFSVAHGTHRWTLAEPEAAASAPRTVRELIDDESSWGAFTAVTAEFLHLDPARTAALLAPWFDRDLAALDAGVWTKSWPTPAALAALIAVREHGTADASKDRA